MIIDNFLTTFDELKKSALASGYGGIVNPADGVLYPDINADIPESVREELQARLDDIFKMPINIDMIFIRLTSQNTPVPSYQAHTDSIMGYYTLLLYLNDGPGGTSFVKHKETGMDSDPRTQEHFEAWERDTNITDAWEITEMVEMKENRVNIISSHRMHRAEPVGGFGESVSDGRLVLTAFLK